MEASEVAGLDSLIDLINEDYFDSVSCGYSGKDQPKEAELDAFIGLINENDTACDTSVTDKTTDHKTANKANDDISFLFPSAAKKVENPSISQNTKYSFVHNGDTSSDEDEREYLTAGGKQIKRKISHKSYHDRSDKKRQSNITWKSENNTNTFVSSEKSSSIDSLSGIRIVKPLVPSDIMEKRMQGRKLIKMSFIKDCMKKGNIEGDWVTVGVVVRKIPPKTSKNGKTFSIWKLTDLHNTEKILSLFLFGVVHNEHWKTAVGTVIGLLNPTILDSRSKEEYMSIKIDHPGKLMIIGTSKDFGYCKSKRKDGSQCPNVVNLSQCQYCAYHVKSEYKKFNNRSELQTSYSSRGINMKEKVLKGQNFFYAGQTFASLGKPQKRSNTMNSKDKLTLTNLGLQRKAATVLNEEKSKSIKKVAEMYGDSISTVAANNSEFINNQLTIPSAGSRNLLQHMIKRTKEPNICGINPKDLLKQQAKQINIMHLSKRKDDNMILKNLEPVLGKGLSPGESVTLDVLSGPNSKAAGHYAKLKAIQKIKEAGPLRKKNPNSVKSKPEPKKIEAALDMSIEKDSADNKTSKMKATVLQSKLGSIDLNSERIQNILNRKSSHAYEVEMAEMEKEAAYFDRLEKKEEMEEKMISTKEVVCDVVSCKQCRYTAHNAADRCKNENHPLKCHKAIKRFFACKDCKYRTYCFSRFPLKSCRNCSGSCFERTGMMKVRSGPKLDSEVFNITTDDVYYLNSL